MFSAFVVSVCRFSVLPTLRHISWGHVTVYVRVHETRKPLNVIQSCVCEALVFGGAHVFSL